MVRGYSEHQAEEMGFPRSQYQFPNTAGKGTGILVMKIWGNKCLVCYFDMDDGEKIKLAAFREHTHDRFFQPEKSELDLAGVEIGSVMEISYGITGTGRANFLSAKV